MVLKIFFALLFFIPALAKQPSESNRKMQKMDCRCDNQKAQSNYGKRDPGTINCCRKSAKTLWTGFGAMKNLKKHGWNQKKPRDEEITFSDQSKGSKGRISGSILKFIMPKNKELKEKDTFQLKHSKKKVEKNPSKMEILMEPFYEIQKNLKRRRKNTDYNKEKRQKQSDEMRKKYGLKTVYS